MISHRQLFLNYLAQTSETPLMLEIEKAEGLKLYNKEGKAYFDLISGIAVSNIGHRHPKVVEAIKNQLDKYLHLMVYGEYIQSPQTLLAQCLCETLPSTLNNVYFVNSGSEAVEGALKLAKRYTGRKKIIAFKNAYHGSTHGALSVTGNDMLKTKFEPLLPYITHLEFGNVEELKKIDNQTAGVIIETVQGEAGVRLANTDFFQMLRQKCTETKSLLIVDEIQCGIGRTGKFWAFEHYEFVPDILLSAKALGGGLPLGCFISSQEIMSSLKKDPILGHITTFGGHPLSATSSLASINVLKEEKLISQVDEKANLFVELLRHDKIKEVRHKGLMMAVEFESFDYLKKIIHALIKEGVITDWFLFCNNSMRIAPPLTIKKEDIILVCNKIIEVISKIK